MRNLSLTALLFLIGTAAVVCRAQSAPGEIPVKPVVAPEKQPVKPGSAWTITDPLGLPVESDIDTLTYNYQRRAIPNLVSDAYASTGNIGAEGINMIYFQRPRRNEFFFDDALSAWLPSFASQKFYNVYIPTTIVQYNFAGNRENHTDRLQADFAGNVNRRIGIGAFLDFIYSKGCYEAQATDDLSFGGTVYYKGERYEMEALFQRFNFLNKENGGITDDLYITDPAQLQGGVNSIEPKSIPTRLNAVHSRLSGTNFYMSHALKVGFWTTEQVNDTLTRAKYVPVTRFIYSLDYTQRRHFFISTNTTQAHDFWKDFYRNPDGSEERTRYWSLTNTLGIEMIEGFRKWAKFGLSAYASVEARRFMQTTHFPSMELTEQQTQELTPLPQGFSVAPVTTQTQLFVGGRLSKQRGNILRYAADIRFGLVGEQAGDIDASGEIETKFLMLGDTVRIHAHGLFGNNEVPYLLRHYISNHFAWDNDFGKTRRFHVGGELVIPWTRTTISANFENMQNYVFFNSDSNPEQYGGHIQVFAASLCQKLKFGIWNWDNTLTYQTTSNQSILPLPALSIYSNMYLGFTAFKVLKLQMGVDCNYYTAYTGYDYQPATMTFHVQGGDNKIKVGNYPYLNLYATARLYKVRFYVLWSHFNQSFSDRNYFLLPHYPANPSRFQLGLSVDFPD